MYKRQNLYNEAVENRTGATPLMLACAPPQRNAAVVRLLLEEGCQHRIATAREKQQPLHYASTAEIAEALLSFERDMPLIKARVVAPHPDVRATDALGGCTPLHVAARNGRTEIVEAILSHKRLIVKARAPVDAPMREAFERHAAGETAVARLAREQELEVVAAKALERHGHRQRQRAGRAARRAACGELRDYNHSSELGEDAAERAAGVPEERIRPPGHGCAAAALVARRG